MADIRFESPLPEDDPDRRTIEGAIRETIQDYAGVWRALIRRARTEPCWVVQMGRTDGEFKRTFLLDLRTDASGAPGPDPSLSDGAV